MTDKIVAPNEPLKTHLHSKLNEFSSWTRMLLELINTDKSAFSGSVATSTTGGARTNEPDQSTSSVLDKLIEKDREIQELVETALKMRNRQHDIDWLETQLENCKSDVEELQNRLYDAEKLLELTVHHGKQKLASIDQSQKGAVSPEKLISYAHKISQASTAVSPVGWQPSDPRRPFPQDIEMRAGILGRLSSNGTVTEINEANVKDEKDAFGVLGMNQNNNRSLITETEKQKDQLEQDPMSEDTSSSSDEAMHF